MLSYKKDSFRFGTRTPKRGETGAMAFSSIFTQASHALHLFRRPRGIRRWPLRLCAFLLLASTALQDAPSLPLPGFSATIDLPTRPPPRAPGLRRDPHPTAMDVGEELTVSYASFDHQTLEHLSVDLATIFEGPWTEDSLLAKSLERSGATHLRVGWQQGLRQMTFMMDMKVPWHHVETVEAWSGKVVSGVDVSSSEMRINSTVRSLRSTNHSWMLEISFDMDAPVLERLRPKLLIQLEPRAQGLEVWTGGLLEWKAHCHFLIRRPMEHGFFLGLARLSRAVLEELRTLADPAKQRFGS
ncbi:unnamed protein product [Durusdinium trenchii]|uniref:Ribosome association toxin RatA n=1 Tax=Durusdinium trenchii TaxID=1381693 RepID=A0ABP0I352_9DINO